MGSWKLRYPSIPNLVRMRPTPRLLLGKRLSWTHKEDGECVTIWINEKVATGEKFVQISSRNQIDGEPSIVNRVKSSEDYPKILELLEDNPEFVCYVEECPKGLSVTRVKSYDRTYLFLFDIYDRSTEKFLSYVNVHQHAFHHKIPVVELYAETRFTSMKQLLKFRDEVLKYCKKNNLEGMVIKAFSRKFGYVQAKVKQDTPQPKRRKIKKGEPQLPPIPEGEIMGAINKVHQELGDEDFQDVSKAMPLIAIEVGKEVKKHFYSKPTGKLFGYYKTYLERLLLLAEENDKTKIDSFIV